MSRNHHNGDRVITPRLIKNARKTAGVRQEDAAKALGVSVRTMQAYETGEYPLPIEVFKQLSEMYENPTMCTEYCREACPMKPPGTAAALSEPKGWHMGCDYHEDFHKPEINAHIAVMDIPTARIGVSNEWNTAFFRVVGADEIERFADALALLAEKVRIIRADFFEATETAANVAGWVVIAATIGYMGWKVLEWAARV